MDKFTERSFAIPEGGCGGYFAIDNFSRRVTVKEVSECWGCRYYVDAGDCVEFVVQGIIAVDKFLVVALPSNENPYPYRFGKLWGHANAVFIPPRVVKYPKVLPPNTSFKEMISGLQNKVLEELRADLAKVDNCPTFSFDPQQLEADLCGDWKTIPAHFFEYGYRSPEGEEGFIEFLGRNTRMIVHSGCQASYYIKDRLFDSLAVDGPAGA